MQFFWITSHHYLLDLWNQNLELFEFKVYFLVSLFLKLSFYKNVKSKNHEFLLFSFQEFASTCPEVNYTIIWIGLHTYTKARWTATKTRNWWSCRFRDKGKRSSRNAQVKDLHQLQHGKKDKKCRKDVLQFNTTMRNSTTFTDTNITTMKSFEFGAGFEDFVTLLNTKNVLLNLSVTIRVSFEEQFECNCEYYA